MTREELAHKWNGYKGIIIYPTDSVEELINSTIEALEQEPCEDYIPRDYVITLLEDKKRTRKEITNRIYEYVQGVSK